MRNYNTQKIDSKKKDVFAKSGTNTSDMSGFLSVYSQSKEKVKEGNCLRNTNFIPDWSIHSIEDKHKGNIDQINIPKEKKITDRDPTDNTTAHTSKPTKSNDENNKYAEKARILSKQMISSQNELSKQYKGQELKQKKEEMLRQQFADIINVDPFFGSILKQVKDCYEDAVKESDKFMKEKYEMKIQAIQQEYEKNKEGLKKENEKNERLVKEILLKTKERDEQAALIESQKQTIALLKKQNVDEKKHSSQEIKLTQEKAQKLEEELNAIYQENEKLTIIVKQLYSGLKQSKMRENTLMGFLKGDERIPQIPKNKSHSIAPCKKSIGEPSIPLRIIEVGKNKVKIPVLDFSKLAPKKPSKITIVKYQSNSSNSDYSASALDQDQDQDQESNNIVV